MLKIIQIFNFFVKCLNIFYEEKQYTCILNRFIHFLVVTDL